METTVAIIGAGIGGVYLAAELGVAPAPETEAARAAVES